MILFRGNAIKRLGDPAQVDGIPSKLQFIGFAQPFIEIIFSQIEGMHFLGHPCGVIIPEKKVNWRRLFPEQVIIDKIMPDQSIRP